MENKLISEIKAKLKESLNENSSKEDIERVAQLDKQLDEVAESFEKAQAEVQAYKEIAINQVKNTGFKPKDQADDIGVSETKSLDDIMLEEARNIEQQRKQ